MLTSLSLQWPPKEGLKRVKINLQETSGLLKRSRNKSISSDLFYPFIGLDQFMSLVFFLCLTSLTNRLNLLMETNRTRPRK